MDVDVALFDKTLVIKGKQDEIVSVVVFDSLDGVTLIDQESLNIIRALGRDDVFARSTFSHPGAGSRHQSKHHKEPRNTQNSGDLFRIVFRVRMTPAFYRIGRERDIGQKPETGGRGRFPTPCARTLAPP